MAVVLMAHMSATAGLLSTLLHNKNAYMNMNKTPCIIIKNTRPDKHWLFNSSICIKKPRSALTINASATIRTHLLGAKKHPLKSDEIMWTGDLQLLFQMTLTDTPVLILPQSWDDKIMIYLIWGKSNALILWVTPVSAWFQFGKRLK